MTTTVVAPPIDVSLEDRLAEGRARLAAQEAENQERIVRVQEKLNEGYRRVLPACLLEYVNAEILDAVDAKRNAALLTLAVPQLAPIEFLMTENESGDWFLFSGAEPFRVADPCLEYYDDARDQVIGVYWNWGESAIGAGDLPLALALAEQQWEKAHTLAAEHGENHSTPDQGEANAMDLY